MSPTELAKCRRVLAAVLAVAASAGLARDAHAHPHVWATVRSEIILDANRQITGVRHAWTFDEMYSAMAEPFWSSFMYFMSCKGGEVQKSHC